MKDEIAGARNAVCGRADRTRVAKEATLVRKNVSAMHVTHNDNVVFAKASERSFEILGGIIEHRATEKEIEGLP